MTKESKGKGWLITDKQIEIFTLRKIKGFSLREVQQRTAVSASNIPRMIRNVERNYPKLEKLVYDVIKSKVVKLGSNVHQAQFLMAFDRLVEGYYPIGRIAFGYRRLRNGKITVDEREAQIVRKVFQGRSKGNSMSQIADKNGFSGPHQIERMLTNAIYIGEIVWNGHVYPGGHTPIISENLWKKVQDIQHLLGEVQYSNPPLGYKWVAGLLQEDPESAVKIKQIFRLRIKGLKFKDIGKLQNLRRGRVRYIIRNPVYKGMVRREGKLVKGKHKAIIDPKVWERANKIPRSLSGAEARHEMGLQTREKVYDCLPSTSREIAEKLGIDKSTALKHLRDLRKKGRIEAKRRKIPKGYIEWYPV